MLSTEEQQQKINSCRERLLSAIVQASERTDIGRNNEKRAQSLDTELDNYIKVRDTVREVINHISSMYKNIQKYADDRRELSMEMLKLAIAKAGFIVPDAAIDNIHLEVEDKKACIVDNEGIDVNLKEGSAYRTVMSALIRYTLLMELPDAIKIIFFDEAFGTLSEETNNQMREYFSVFQKDVAIVGIEQRDSLFQGLPKVKFIATKDADGTPTIRQETL